MRHRSSYIVIFILLISSIVGGARLLENKQSKLNKYLNEDKSNQVPTVKTIPNVMEIKINVEELSSVPIIGNLIQISNLLKFEITDFSNFNTNNIDPNLIVSALKERDIFIDVIHLSGFYDNKTVYSPDPWDTALEITATSNVILENNTFNLDISKFGGKFFALRVEDSNNFTIRNNDFTINAFSVDMTAIEIINSTLISIHNNTIHRIETTSGFVSGITIDTSPNTNISYNFINELSSSNTCSALKIVNSANSLVFGNIIDNNENSLTIDSVYIGIQVDGAAINISSNIIQNVRSNKDIIAISLTSSGNSHIFNNFAAYFYSLKSKIIGLDIIDSDNLVISNNTIGIYQSSGTGFDFANEKSVYGIKLETSNNYLIYNNTIAFIVSESNVFGVEVTTSFPGNISSNIFTYFTGDTIYGIALNSPSQTTEIVDNTMAQYNGKSIRAIYTANSAVNILRNNIIYTDSQTLSIILEIVNGTNSKIINNTITDHDSTSSFFTVYGVKIETSNGVLIQGNKISRLSTSFVEIVGIDIYDSDDLDILNNTIIDITTGTDIAIAINIDKTTSSNIKFNNITNIQGAILTTLSFNVKPTFETQTLSDLSYAIQLQHASFVVIENNIITSVSLWLKSDEGNTDITYLGNEIDGDKIALITFNRPLDLTISFDDTNTTISWLANTNPTNESDTYEIYLNGNFVINGSWVSSVRIFYSLVNLTGGVNTIKLILKQSNGIEITDSVTVTVTEFSLPLLTTTQEDIRMVVGSTEKQLRWVATDVNPGTYDLLRNGSSVAFGVWFNNSEIVFTLENLPVGRFNFTIIITDNTGNSISDSVAVTILDKFEIFFSVNPVNIWFPYNETGNQLIWQVESIESGNYIIKQDGKDVLNGEWEPSQEIIYELGILEIGEYIFSILIIDDVGNDLTHEVIVQILPLEEVQTTEDENRYDFLTDVDTDLTSIRENLLPFAIFAGTLSTIVVSIYLFKRRAKLKNVAGKIGSKAKKTVKRGGGTEKTSSKSSKKTAKNNKKMKKDKK